MQLTGELSTGRGCLGGEGEGRRYSGGRTGDGVGEGEESGEQSLLSSIRQGERGPEWISLPIDKGPNMLRNRAMSVNVTRTRKKR